MTLLFPVLLALGLSVSRPLAAAAVPLLAGALLQLWLQFGAIEAAAGLPLHDRFEAVARTLHDAALVWPAMGILALVLLAGLPWGEHRAARFALLFGAIQSALLAAGTALVHHHAVLAPNGFELAVWRASVPFLEGAQAIGVMGIAAVTLVAAWLEPDREALPWLALPVLALPLVAPNLHGVWLDAALWSL